MIKVLVAEDSYSARELLIHILRSDPEIEVVGCARDGAEAVESARTLKPCVVTMDINMPVMDGLEATRRIMESSPVPVVIVSASWDAREVDRTFRAMEAGALTVVRKPCGPGDPRYEEEAGELVRTVKLMSEVKVVRRWAREKKPAADPVSVRAVTSTRSDRAGDVRIVAIGASTGGPAAIRSILARLPAGYPAPIAIVQHMSRGFSGGFAEWMGKSCAMPVRLMTHGERLLPGHVYVAPDDFHAEVEPGGRISLSRDAPEHGLRPSVSRFFRSVAKAYGKDAAGVLLTGMGRDGALELRIMKDAGAVTIAQDPESSVIHGMPGEAIRIGAATHVLSPEDTAMMLIALMKGRPGNGKCT
ncbi:MAG: chemotaxis-specific protein-glutamate methyltransferase CheB [bacterium]|nr:chemotaxis-specific protein-glutamate methyltransferase CheB [bacterium]